MAKSRQHKRQMAERRRRALQAQLEAAARRRRRRQQLIAGGAALAVLAAVVVGAVALAGGGDDDTDLTSATTLATDPEPTQPALESARGKPCVAQAEQPPGAPVVPVKVGPPPTELVKEDLKPGTGAEVKPTDTVTVHYVGVSCSTGKVFDSSYVGQQPATFPLDGVIAGWREGIPGMKVGGSRLLGIPSEMAYGPNGNPPDIAPDEALWFVVDVQQAKAA